MSRFRQARRERRWSQALLQDPKWRALNEAEVAEILRRLPLSAEQDVLDLGAGFGRFTHPLAQQVRQVMALDQATAALAENRRLQKPNTQITYRAADATREDLGAQAFDGVLVNWLLMYCSPAEIERLMQSISRSLRPGGWLFIRESCAPPAQSGWQRWCAYWRFRSLPRAARQHLGRPAWETLWHRLWRRSTGPELRPVATYETWFAQYPFSVLETGQIETYEAAFGVAQQRFWLLQRQPLTQYAESVGDGLQMAPRQWQFSGETWRHFEQHVRRSIPFYESFLELTTQWVADQVQTDGLVFELGCATGELAQRLSESCPQAEVVGIDAEPTMIASAQRRQRPNLSFTCADIRHFDWSQQQGSVAAVVLSFTLQFIPVADRLPLLKALVKALQPGGILILAEKVVRDDPEHEARCRRVHHAFKRSQGLTQAEIDQKDRSLDGVLIPLTESENEALLAQAGLSRCAVVFDQIRFRTWLCQR
jgi:tRNA (cmo5U34)-methyltransferase